MKQKITPRTKIRKIQNDLNGYSKISNRTIKELLEIRYNMDLSINQISYYRNNLKIKKRKDINTPNKRIKELNDSFKELSYIETKHLYNFIKKVYDYYNMDIKSFDFKELDNSLSYYELITETKTILKRKGLFSPLLKIDLEMT